MGKRWVYMLAAPMLVAGSLSTANSAAGWTMDTVEGGSGDGPVAASGRLLTQEGKPAHGIALRLEAWPSSDTLQRLKPGESVQTVPVGKVVTKRDGTFSLRVANVAALSRMKNRSGVVDLSIVGEGEGAQYNFSFPLEADGLIRGKVGSGKPGLDLRPVGQLSKDQSARAEATAPPMEKACTYRLLEQLAPRTVIVGSSYVQTSGVTADFQFSTGASSALGVAVKSPGSVSYKASGESSVSSSSTIDFPSVGANRKRIHRTKFVYGRYRVDCGSILGPSTQIRPMRLAGGDYSYTPTNTLASTKCVSYSGGTHTNERSAAITWTNGVDISSLISIDLSSRTGYSTAAKAKYTFSASRKLCGTHDYPGGTPRTLFAKS